MPFFVCISADRRVVTRVQAAVMVADGHQIIALTVFLAQPLSKLHLLREADQSVDLACHI